MHRQTTRRFAFLLLLLPQLLRADGSPPPLMLATVYAPGLPVSEYWVSEKLDGVRARWNGRKLITRGGYPVNAPAWFSADWPQVPMDGELWMGRGRFEVVSAIVRADRPDQDAWRGVRFMVFDLPAHGGPFEARVETMRRLLNTDTLPWLQAIEQYRVKDAAALDARLDTVLAAGGEGLMLHHRAARYRSGRSEGLLKYKPYEDAEARVVGHTEGKGKYAGMLGALVVERTDGLRFRIGTGFSDAERADPPAVGSWVTYRYNGFTRHGVPRFARFLRVRPEGPPPTPAHRPEREERTSH